MCSRSPASIVEHEYSDGSTYPVPYCRDHAWPFRTNRGTQGHRSARRTPPAPIRRQPAPLNR